MEVLSPEYSQVINEAHTLFRDLAPIDKWEFYSEAHGVKSYTRQDAATGLKMARGEGKIHKPATEIVKSALDSSAVITWGKNLSIHERIHEEDEYYLFRSLDIKRMLVAQRETLVVNQVIKQEDGSTLILQRSLDHPSFPENKDYVRAFVYLFAWLLTPNQEDPNKTDISCIIYVDPKGWVPKPVFNAFINDQALTVTKLKEYLEKV
jgi:hypothetical protein